LVETSSGRSGMVPVEFVVTKGFVGFVPMPLLPELGCRTRVRVL
jgi:hypothetical protein